MPKTFFIKFRKKYRKNNFNYEKEDFQVGNYEFLTAHKGTFQNILNCSI